MKKRGHDDQPMVMEQKGWRVVLLGLVLASLFSLTFKAVFSPRRIQYELERALSGADPRIQSQLQGAHLSLSDGVWPRLAIVIDHLKIETSDPCLFAAKAKIQQLVLPVAFSSLLDRALVFKKIQVGHLEMQMGARREGCGGSTALMMPPLSGKNLDQVPNKTEALVAGAGVSESRDPEPKLESKPEPKPKLEPESKPEPKLEGAGSEVPKEKSPKDKSAMTPMGEDGGDVAPLGLPTPSVSLDRPPLVQTLSLESSFLKNIEFKSIQLQFLEWPLFLFKMRNVSVQLPVEGDANTHVEGQLTVMNTKSDPDLALQGIHAHMELTVEPNKASAKIEGAWREGRLEVEGRWAHDRKDFHWLGNFKQIPWSQLIVLAKTLGKREPLPASSQAWVSGILMWDHNLSGPEELQLREGHIEGEFGDFVVGKVVATKGSSENSWEVSPYKILAKAVNLDILTRMVGWENPPSMFSQLGIFDGQADMVENQLVKMDGHWTDLEVIFANRGLRQIQRVKNLNLSLSGGSNRWTGFLSRMELDEGNWNGDISFLLDQNLKVVEFETQFDHLRLHPDVESLMTLRGKLSPMEGHLSVRIVDGLIEKLGGYLKADEINVREISLGKARVDFEGHQKNLQGKFQIAEMRWPRDELSLWPQPLPEAMESLRVKFLSGSFEKAPGHFHAKEIQGHLVDLRTRLQLDWGWDNDTQLSGNLTLRGDRKNLMYQLSGTREQPEWKSIDRN